MSIAEHINSLRNEIPCNVKVIAVSKTMPVSAILEAYQAGQRVFGENRVQELLQKQPQLPSDIEWHLIGHLQTNKVRSVVPVVSMIQSADSLRLLAEINKEALKINKIMDCLLEIRIAREETKFGLTAEDSVRLLESDEYAVLRNVRIKGLMGIATFTEDIEQVKNEFRYLAAHFRTIKDRFFKTDPSFTELSIGMSGDYKYAIDEGSTMIRIGTLIFGSRSYK